MPSNSPGIHIRELPSDVHTITGAASSITAFIGRAKRGPINQAISINSFAEYESVFGGLDLNSAMSYAVKDYYLNGGQQAIIGRLYQAPSTGAMLAEILADSLHLVAVNPGAWGNQLRVRIDHAVSNQAALQQGLNTSDLFNIFITNTDTGEHEQFHNVSVVAGPNHIAKVLFDKSKLVQVKNPTTLPLERPAQNAEPEQGEDQSISDYVVSTKAVDSDPLMTNSYVDVGFSNQEQGLYLLKQADIFNLLCLPNEGIPNYPARLLSEAIALCEEARAILILDSASHWKNKEAAINNIDLYVPSRSRNAALFFPRLKQVNPLRNNQVEEFPACGAIAGVIVRTDSERGVWSAPAGIEAMLKGISGLTIKLSETDNAELNPLAINCLRSFPSKGHMIWGARLLSGSDVLADEYKYIPVRRLALFIEESVYRGTQWVDFEANDEALWAQIRMNVGNFMHNLFRQGAFQGFKQKDAYFVKCDQETITQNDINNGLVNIQIGFAAIKPAEFMIVKVQQILKSHLDA